MANESGSDYKARNISTSGVDWLTIAIAIHNSISNSRHSQTFSDG